MPEISGDDAPAITASRSRSVLGEGVWSTISNCLRADIGLILAG
jgi:hypothetical protein